MIATLIAAVVAVAGPSPVEAPPSPPEASDGATSEPDPATQELEDERRTVEVRGEAGIGYQERTPLPSPRGDTAATSRGAAASAGFEIGGTPRGGPDFDLFGTLGYRSSLGMRASILDPGGTPRNVRARSQDFRLGFGLRGWPTEQRRVGLSADVGYALRSFHLETQLGFPGYALHGPDLRAGLHLALARGVVRLLIAPHGGLAILSRVRGNDRSPSYGGMAAFTLGAAVRLRGPLFLNFRYDEQHAFIRSDGVRAHDTARWATVGLAIIHRSPKETTP